MIRFLLYFLFLVGGQSLLAQQDTTATSEQKQPTERVTITEKSAPTFGGKSGPSPNNGGSQIERGTSRVTGEREASRETDTAPEGGVEYGSVDSSKTDIINQQIHLYGQAYVRYESFEVKSDYIVFDLGKNEVEALSRIDQLEKPTFTNGDQTVKADHIKFNIETEKGLVHGARIQQDQFFVHGATTKFVRAGQDSLHIDDVVYNKNAVLTTCDHERPHWGIRTTKLKMIPDKLAVIGPFDMELAGIPTPLALPFAFAPLFSISESSSGLIFPSQVLDQSRSLGLGIRGLGYVFAISDRFDLRLNADIYFRGSFNLTAASRYKKRYKYNGGIELSYSRNLLDRQNQETPSVQKSYRISIRHNQDSKAHPYRTIGGSLNIALNGYDQVNYSDAQSQLNAQLNSNFSYNYRYGPNVSLSAGMSHSQDVRTGKISFTLPTMRLNVSKIFPFKLKSGVGKDKWFEKVNLSYVGRFENKVTTGDSILFQAETLDLLRNGFSHETEIGASYKVFNHFSFNTSASYDEFWYFQTYRHSGVENTDGEVVSGFDRLQDMSVRANLTTNIFGTVQFTKGWLRGLRHQATPSIGLSYSPSTEDRYEYILYDDNPPSESEFRYNPFSAERGENLIFNKRLQRGGMAMTYSLNNTFEGKTWSKKDSIEKKFKILNSLNFSGNYNFQADSLNWSPVAMTANARIFKGKSQLSIRGTLDPYKENEVGIRRNEFVDGFLRLDQLTASISTQMSLKELRDLFRGNLEDDEQSTSLDRSDRLSSRERGRRSGRRSQKIQHPELFSWFEGFKISHVYRIGIAERDVVDPDTDEIITPKGAFETKAHTLRFTTGTIPLTDKWGMSVGNLSYDLKNKEWVYPSFTLSRDLHCWRMEISWQPQLDTYTFFIGVKASPFSDFLKYQSGRSSFEQSARFR